jgi:hypothetical protein
MSYHSSSSYHSHHSDWSISPNINPVQIHDPNRYSNAFSTPNGNALQDIFTGINKNIK